MNRLFNWLRMNFEEITKRVTGISCPVFGLQWNPPEAQCALARRVIRFLEDRRVLYVPYDVEIAEYCTQSIFGIREMLTRELGNLDTNSGQVYYSLKAMRAACRRFLDHTQDGDDGPPRRFRHRPDPYDIRAQTFFTALGELRATFGVHLAILAAQHGLDVEDELAAILPAIEDDKIFPYLNS
jgi:hypothetical protein